MSIIRPAVVLTIGAALGATTLVGCSSGTSGRHLTRMAAAMASVSGTGPARQEFQYGDLARMRELGFVHPHGRPLLDPQWQRTVGYGLGHLAAAAPALPKAVGLDPFTADQAVAIGTPPNTAVRIDGGVDADAVMAKLKALGAEPRTFGHTDGLTLGKDNEIDVHDPLTGYGLLGDLNQVVLTDGDMVTSRNGATLQKALGGDPSLLDTDGYRDLADCLGDAIAADIVAAPGDDETAMVYATGVRDPSSRTATDREVLCMLPRPGRGNALKAALTAHLGLHTIDPNTREPLSHYASESQVDTVGDAVRVVLTMRPDGPRGYLFLALQQGAVRVWTS